MRDCDKKVFKNGYCVFVAHTVEAEDIERFVRAVSELSGEKCDWHYMGGRAIIKTLANDRAKVDEAITALLPWLQEKYEAVCRSWSLPTIPNGTVGQFYPFD